MSTIITYEVVPCSSSELGGFNVNAVSGVTANVWADTEEAAVLAFKDNVTKLLPHESAMIFITAEQSEAMEGYEEKEKHGVSSG
tara:strand:+ start:50 stop:301 length:252 start_codon:yes stop_codon:yes gene_type:complete